MLFRSRNRTSEIGILYLNDANRKVISKFLKENNLEFHELLVVKPHVFVSSENPLSGRISVTLDDLEPYPCLSFEQGSFNSFYFAEEILSTLPHKKSIKVSDRATLFNLLVGLNGYTISSGIISHELNGSNVVAVPLQVPEKMEIGYIIQKNVTLSRFASFYIEKLKTTACYK